MDDGVTNAPDSGARPAKRRRGGMTEASAMEVARLRENETQGFGSGMLNIQIESALERAVAPYAKFKPLEAALKVLKEDIAQCNEKQLKHDGKVMSRVMDAFPSLTLRSDRSEFAMRFKPPEEFVLVGSYLLRTLLWDTGEKRGVDVCVSIPHSCLYDKDYRSYRYHDKRLLYLSAIFSHLSRNGHWTELELGTDFVGGDRLRPVLCLRPNSALLRELGATEAELRECERVVVRIMPVVAADRFPHARIRATRPQESAPREEKLTSMHNFSVAGDMVAVEHLKIMHQVKEQCPSFAGAVLLLKLWRRRRNLSITSFALSACLARLVLDGVIPQKASQQHMFRGCLQFVSRWKNPAARAPLYLDSERLCDVLLPTSDDHARQAALEAAAALRTLSASSAGSDALGGAYTSLFAPSRKVTPAEQFDAIVEVAWGEQAGDPNVFAIECAHTVRRALGRWCYLAIHEALEDKVVVGLVLDSDRPFPRVLSAEDAGMDREQFREFWGSRSQLRRFKDGSIVESVVWSAGGTSGFREAATVPLTEHLPGIGADNVHANKHEWDRVLPRLGSDAGAARSAAEQLGSALRALDGLPLTVNAVTFSGDILLGTSVLGAGLQETRYRQSSTVVIAFEPSTRWPSDADAVRAYMAVFLVSLSQALRKKGFDAQATRDCAEVCVGEYVFRVYLRYDSLLPLLSKEDEREEQVWRTVRQPRLHDALKTVCGEGENSAFQGACRLAKRWLSSHALGNHFCDELVELVVARPFFNSDYMPCGRRPSTLSTAFAAFLSTLASFPWESAPLVVDFDRDGKVYEQAEQAFRTLASRRAAPPMIVATPGDVLGKSLSPACHRGPERVVLRRARAAASVALGALQFDDAGRSVRKLDMVPLFRSRDASFDVEIRLREEFVPTAPASIDARKATARRVKLGPLGAKGANGIAGTLVNLDPVQALLDEYQRTFGAVGLFCYDRYGGLNIGMVWRPKVHEKSKFSLYSLPFREPRPKGESESTELVVDREYVMFALERLGGDMVEGVESLESKVDG